MTTTTIEGRWIPTGYSERTHESLPAVVYVDEQNIRAIAYRGKSKKPAWNYRFQSAAHMESEIKTFFGDVAEAEAYKQERRDERKNFVSALIPGDIVYTSWGYDQTNVEFYEIIGKKNKRVTLREIRAKTTETGKHERSYHSSAWRVHRGTIHPACIPWGKGEDRQCKYWLSLRRGAQNILLVVSLTIFLKHGDKKT